MEIKQNPFSLYDFLGYLIPGIFCSLGLLYIFLPVEIGDFLFSDKDLNISVYLLFVICCYVFGHAISYILSVTVEKYSIWTLGYPSRYLLNYGIPGFWRYFWKKAKPVEIHVNYENKDYSFLIAPNHTSGTRVQRFLQWFGRLLICGIILPVVFTDLVIRRCFAYREFLGKPLDEFLGNKIRLKINTFHKEYYKEEQAPSAEEACCTGEVRDPDFFRLIYHYANEHTKNHYGKMQNYVALYGFTRTMCFTLIILFWSYLIHSFLSIGFSWQIVLVASICFASIAIFYLDFNKFFRRYTLEALMAFTAIYSPQDVLADSNN